MHVNYIQTAHWAKENQNIGENYCVMETLAERRLRILQQQLANERFQGMVEGYKLGYAERSRQIREEKKLARTAKVKKGKLYMVQGGKK